MQEPNKFPHSVTITIVLAIIIGLGIFYSTRQKSYPDEKIIKQKIEAQTKKRDSIINKTKNQSSVAARKGDSLIKLLKEEPWKVSNEDVKDSVVVEYLKNYHYSE